MGYYLDGRVTAVIGTHTHVLTADERILEHGTAFMCDAGMTGGQGGMIGVSRESVMPRFLQGLPVKFEQCDIDCAFNGAVIDVNDDTGLAESIIRVNLPIVGG